MSRSPRVLMVTARYYPDAGGTETHVYETARRMARRGLAITILTTDRSGQLAARERIADVEVRRVRAWPKERDWYFAPDVVRIVATERWDLVHFQGAHTLVPPLGMLAACRSRVPYVVTFHSGGHSSPVRNRMRGLQWRFLRPLLVRAERLVAVSAFEAEIFRSRLRPPEDRVVVIPNGADLPSIGARADPDLILSIGRLERYKGHQRVISALPHVLARHPNARLRIVGDGPYAAQLRRLAGQLGVQDRVEIGAVPAEARAEMSQLISGAGLVTLLSDYEAHPVAVVEALALKTPVLVAETSGLREFSARGLAHGVQPQSPPREIARAIVCALESTPRAQPIELPTWDACATRLLQLYGEIGVTCAS